MALPQHKTTLSILRSILGPAGSESCFANKIGRSASWLKKASCGQIPLLRDAAVIIAYETGVSVNWLMHGDTTQSPLDAIGMPYTIETYALHRSKQCGGKERLNDAFARLLASYHATGSRELFVLHFEAFTDEITRKFKKVKK